MPITADFNLKIEASVQELPQPRRLFFCYPEKAACRRKNAAEYSEKACRACKKLPVASFCASETAEKMPLGAAEGFNWIA